MASSGGRNVTVRASHLPLQLIVVACYLIGAVWLGFTVYRTESHEGRGGRIAAVAIATIGAFVHVIALVQERRIAPSAALSPSDTAAMVGLLIASPRSRCRCGHGFGGMAALLLAIAAILKLRFPKVHASTGRPVWLGTAPTSRWRRRVFAFSTRDGARRRAVIVDRRLRSRQPLGWLKILTPIESLESGLFQSILAGFTMLTLALVSGAFFIEDLFAQHLVHKVFFAIIAWVVFGVLLLGRLRFGWRGRQALKWTLSGYVLLGLSYFGSKLVLETMLGKHWG
jgi:hypothetical protein